MGNIIPYAGQKNPIWSNGNFCKSADVLVFKGLYFDDVSGIAFPMKYD
jgi:hypothetical protein